jgi:hypothetical protein
MAIHLQCACLPGSCLHCKKKVSDIPAGDGKIDNLFYRVGSNQDSFEKLLKIDICKGLTNIPRPAKNTKNNLVKLGYKKKWFVRTT